jgi:hypothetical protein
MNHHRDGDADNDLDPAGWNRASYSAHPIDSIEPLSDEPNSYRAAALFHMRLMWAVDEFNTAAPDARLAIIAVGITMGWPSVRGWTRARHCPPDWVHAVDVDPCDCPIQDDSRA